MSLIDLCLVASRRPDLLLSTLEGFSVHVFRNINIGDVFVNLDPIFGGRDEHAQCIEIIRSYFPEANIFEPGVPGFCAAVRRVWGATSGRFVFHLEDDWLPLYDVNDEVLGLFSDQEVAQVSFHTLDRKWDIERKGPFHYTRIYHRIMGIKIPTFRYFPRFTTAPSILSGDFARACALRMLEKYDPEKQFYSGVNPELQLYVSKYKNYIYTFDGGPVIRDLGRAWASEHGIVKRALGSESIWTGGGT